MLLIVPPGVARTIAIKHLLKLMKQKLIVAAVAALVAGTATAEEVDITFTGRINAAQVAGSFPSAPPGDMPVTLTLRSSREIFQWTTVNTAIPGSQARLTSGNFITRGSWSVGGISGSAPYEPLGSSVTGGKFNVLAYDNYQNGSYDKIVGFAADLSTAIFDGRTLTRIEFDLAPIEDIFQWSTNGSSTTATLEDIEWSGLATRLKVTHSGASGITTNSALISSITVTPVVTEEQLDIDNTQNSTGGWSAVQQAQTFTAGKTGLLSKISIMRTGNPEFPFANTVRVTKTILVDGVVLPDETQSLGSFAIPSTDPFEQLIDYDISHLGIDVSAGDQLALWITGNPTSLRVNHDEYLGGQLFWKNFQADWTPQISVIGAADMVFRTFVTVEGASDAPPVADAGAGFSVNEGQVGVALDGSVSSDPDGDPLSYAWEQLTGTPVTLADATAAQTTFDAPLVAIGGETLTFKLTVSANGQSSSDTVDVTVVNVNHPPVADAGVDQSVTEGSPVILQGEDSFDVDNDVFTYSWVQTGGSPTVILSGADTANPTFDAPFAGGGGAPGVVATLVFELTVDDGFPMDVPAPGYTFASSVDSVTVEVTNINNAPIAEAGADQTVDENSAVSLDGSGSSDPDSDPLSYAWSQVGGTPVVLSGAATATPSFTAPFVSPGGEAFTFRLVVDDGFGGTGSDDIVVNVKNVNDPPDASLAQPTLDVLWPPNHKMVAVGITGVSDPDSNATITIDSVFQDEPTNDTGDGDTPIDAVINADGTVMLRAERSGNGDGRVYHIHFTASDPEGSTSGVVTVSVPKKKRASAADGGPLHRSTE